MAAETCGFAPHWFVLGAIAVIARVLAITIGVVGVQVAAVDALLSRAGAPAPRARILALLAYSAPLVTLGVVALGAPPLWQLPAPVWCAIVLLSWLLVGRAQHAALVHLPASRGLALTLALATSLLAVVGAGLLELRERLPGRNAPPVLAR
jgi:hypothetical protein